MAQKSDNGCRFTTHRHHSWLHWPIPKPRHGYVRKGLLLQAIDDEATHKARRRELTSKETLSSVQTAFEMKHKSPYSLRIRFTDFDQPLGDEDIGLYPIPRLATRVL